MQKFSTLAALAALAASSVQAQQCESAPGSECSDFDDWDTAFDTFSNAYEFAWYQTTTADDYKLRMVRYRGDENQDDIILQDTKGPVLLLNDFRQDCKSWLTETQSAGSDSIPLLLFGQGYDVWFGCKRGTEESREHVTLDPVNDAADYWAFNSQTIGENDVPAMIAKILETRYSENGSNCADAKNLKVQVVNFGYSTAETLVTLASYPTDAAEKISQIVNVAPCAIPTTLEHPDPEDDRRRMSSTIDDKLSANETRALEGFADIDANGQEREGRARRQLPSNRGKGRGNNKPKNEPKPKSESKSKSPKSTRSVSSNSSESSVSHSPSSSKSKSKSPKKKSKKWFQRAEEYCAVDPEPCYHYCDWYPRYCDAFCDLLPQYCIPDDVKEFYNFLYLAKHLGIYSLYGEDWESQVDMLCEHVSVERCDDLQASVSKGYAETSIQQYEHWWQKVYTGQFDAYNPDFIGSAGWLVDQADIAGVPNVEVNSINIYMQGGDPICDSEVNMRLFDNIPAVYRPFETELTDPSVTRDNIQGANTSLGLTLSLSYNLSLGSNQPLENCPNFSQWAA